MKWLFATALICVVLGCSNSQEENSKIVEQGEPWFSNEADERGFTFTYQSGFDGTPRFPEIFGGSAALFDADGDGDLDLYAVQGGSVVDTTQTFAANQLFLNDGKGQFTNVTEGSGADDTGFGMGVATGDYDNDGDVDLYITNVGANTLLRNNGDGQFTDVTLEAGVGDEGWGTSTAFFDMEHDGDLDLVVINYIEWNLGVEMVCESSSGILDYCHPMAFDAPARDVLYRNNGDGTFTDISAESGFNTAWGNGLGVVIGDVDGDGFQDIFVANDEMKNQLWMNQHDGTFIDDALVSGVAVDSNGKPKAGMGTDFADIDNDGDLDLLVVNLVAQSDSMFINRGGWFDDGTAKSGLASTSRPYTRFGVGFHDFDNDGVLDIYMANGRVLIAEQSITSDYYAEDNLLIQGNIGGTFTEVLPKGGVGRPLIHTSRGAAFGDVDGDGGVDIVVINRDAPAYLLMNTVQDRGHFAMVHLVDANGAPATDAIVRFHMGDKEIRREVRTSGGYLSAHDPMLHVGIGAESYISNIEVTWSDGTTQVSENIKAGELRTIRKQISEIVQPSNAQIQWRGFKKETLPDGWRLNEGVLTHIKGGGDIVTFDQYENFVLELDWKIVAGGNSGIFFHVDEQHGAVWETGPEMQVLDNEAHRDGLDLRTSAGSNYALHEPIEDVTKPAGEWNHAKLIVDGPHVEHWINGVKLLEYELWSTDWKERVLASKFKDMPDYGMNKTGHIALQDHGDLVSYRNIRIESK